MIRAVHVDRRELLAILVGGFAGALARVELGVAISHSGGAWSWATLVVNIVGALILGYVVTRLQERLAPTTYWRPLIGTGFCGALTTFSTFQVELLQMARHDRAVLFVGYAAASMAGCFAAVHVASALTRRARL